MYIKVTTHPDAKTNQVIQVSEDRYIVHVKAVAERGEANQAVRELLAASFQLPAGRLRLIKGGKRKSKIFEIIEPQSQ